jgi:hypothetical protein
MYKSSFAHKTLGAAVMTTFVAVVLSPLAVLGVCAYIILHFVCKLW